MYPLCAGCCIRDFKAGSLEGLDQLTTFDEGEKVTQLRKFIAGKKHMQDAKGKAKSL